ncbi:hypothetical protein B0H13DRAFT_2020946 [Mycena leptocephala]|nr:hypothetical protein B0H13DRAFT_2020946 [Mycena leptocephala]
MVVTHSAPSHHASPMRAASTTSRFANSSAPGNYLSTRISASNVHTQLQSTLFTTLFPELRNIVFTLALTEYDDPTRPYSKHECFYRPGFEFADDPQQREAVSQVRFFTQMFWLEGRKFQEWPAGLAVRKLAITIRHSDWWFWENGEALRIKAPREGWGAWVGSIPQLEELELEFETIEPKKEQLEERVRVAQGWRFPLADGASLVHDGEAPVKSMWAGTSRMAPGRASNVWGAPRNPQVEASLDLRFPLDLKLHVRKLKFVKSIRSL